ncbi:hypothetical protein INR49_018392 [Caranx melampygus]|nr:hypothetical protein INR49_018392 [Caranx melampygus]
MWSGAGSIPERIDSELSSSLVVMGRFPGSGVPQTCSQLKRDAARRSQMICSVVNLKPHRPNSEPRAEAVVTHTGDSSTFCLQSDSGATLSETQRLKRLFVWWQRCFSRPPSVRPGLAWPGLARSEDDVPDRNSSAQEPLALPWFWGKHLWPKGSCSWSQATLVRAPPAAKPRYAQSANIVRARMDGRQS